MALTDNQGASSKNNGDRSHHKHVEHGFSQVRDPGPTLFLAMLNDLDSSMDQVYCMVTTKKSFVVRGGDPVEAASHAEHHFGLGKAFGFRPIS